MEEAVVARQDVEKERLLKPLELLNKVTECESAAIDQIFVAVEQLEGGSSGREGVHAWTRAIRHATLSIIQAKMDGLKLLETFDASAKRRTMERLQYSKKLEVEVYNLKKRAAGARPTAPSAEIVGKVAALEAQLKLRVQECEHLRRQSADADEMRRRSESAIERVDVLSAECDRLRRGAGALQKTQAEHLVLIAELERDKAAMGQAVTSAEAAIASRDGEIAALEAEAAGLRTRLDSVHENGGPVREFNPLKGGGVGGQGVGGEVRNGKGGERK